jgi:hypothetical protein
MRLASLSLRVLPILIFGSCACLSPNDRAALAQPNTKKSISGWVSCNAASDDAEGVARAFAAARHGAFTLSVDCPVRIHIGTDIGRPIFIDDGTTVEFTGSGKFMVDNTFVPAFVIANSNDITLSNWNVEYDASLPVDPNAGGYQQNGRLVSGKQPGSAFNDIRLTQWLTANRGITFDKSQGFLGSKWTGPTNACAMFLIVGDSARLKVSGLHAYAPETAGAERFIPVVFSMSPNYRSNQTVNAKTPATVQVLAVPHQLTFSDVRLDGTYMGWVGGAQDESFENIVSRRYADLQDAQGGNSGGLGKWFAPPHLFYLNYSPTGDPALFNKNIRINHVVDSGVRSGQARDLGGGGPLSGNALSLKIGCLNCSVNDYKSARPDGFADVLSSDGLTISNVDATYDSRFLNDLYPGIRFPQPPYRNVTLENVALKDAAAVTAYQPIGNADKAYQGISFKNVQISINRWKGSAPLPTISGLRVTVSP